MTTKIILAGLGALVAVGTVACIIIKSRTRKASNKVRVWKCSNCGRVRASETELICPACRKGPFVEDAKG